MNDEFALTIAITAITKASGGNEGGTSLKVAVEKVLNGDADTTSVLQLEPIALRQFMNLDAPNLEIQQFFVNLWQNVKSQISGATLNPGSLNIPSDWTLSNTVQNLTDLLQTAYPPS
jgi:hypothetical protein